MRFDGNFIDRDRDFEMAEAIFRAEQTRAFIGDHALNVTLILLLALAVTCVWHWATS